MWELIKAAVLGLLILIGGTFLAIELVGLFIWAIVMMGGHIPI